MATLYVFADEAAKNAAINDGSGVYTADNTFNSFVDALGFCVVIKLHTKEEKYQCDADHAQNAGDRSL